MHFDLLTTAALIGLLGIGSQWIAWRLQLPAILVMSIAGLTVGPGLQMIDPSEQFSDAFRPMISIAVAVILFEGGLTLNLSELRASTRSVWRLSIFGVPLAWALGSAAAYFLTDLSLATSVLLGGILVVTGPTVIIPLLRQARLKRRPATILKWEGIVNDPIGAILAIIVFEYILYSEKGHSWTDIAGGVALGSTFATLIGIALGRLLVWAFRAGHVPEFLKAPVILCGVLLCFAAADSIQHETGLLAVTVMGLTIANSRLPSIDDLRRFKETIATILISGVFILLTADLDRSIFTNIDLETVMFVLAVLFIVRPLTVLPSMIGTDLTWQERLFVSWIAPRGIVAIAIASVFAQGLTDIGSAEGEKMVSLVLFVVFATIIAHGLSCNLVARSLGLVANTKPGVLIVGASRFSLQLARALKELELGVTIADSNWRRLRDARLEGIDVFYGEVLSEVAEHHLEFSTFSHVIAATDNDHYNSLIAVDFAPEIGRNQIFQIGGSSDDPDSRHHLSHTIRGRSLTKEGIEYYDLQARMMEGWTFRKTKLSEEYTFDQYKEQNGEDIEVLLSITKEGKLIFRQERSERPSKGSTILAFVPAEDAPARERETESATSAA